MNRRGSEFPAIDEEMETVSEDYTNDNSDTTFKVSKGRSLADIASEFERTVEVQNRRYRMKVYKNAFIGSDACTTLRRIWLGENFEDFTQHQAMLLGRYINKKFGLFEHVTRDHNTLEDDYLFYRFTSIRKVPPPDFDGDEAFLEKLLGGEVSESDESDREFDEFQVLAFLTESSIDDSSNYLSVGSVRHLNSKQDSVNDRRISTRRISKGITRRSGFKESKDTSSVRSYRPFTKRFSKREERLSLFDIKDNDLHEAAKAFEIGVEVKTNRYRGKAFKGTFVGADAVDVLIATRFATSRTVAEKIGQALARQFNLFEHVSQEHEFKDDFLFYRFIEPNKRQALVPANEKVAGALTIAPTLEEIAQKFETMIPVCNRRFRLKVYEGCFLGHAAVAMLVRSNFASSRSEAVDLGRRLASELNIFEHVTGDHELEDDVFFYKFTDPSKRTSKEAKEANNSEQDGLALGLGGIAADFRRGVPVKTHLFRFVSYKKSFVGSAAVDFLVNSSLAPTRKDAVALGRRLSKELNLFQHVKRSHDFKDDFLFYRFTEDDGASSSLAFADGASSIASEDTTISAVEMFKLAKMMRENIKVKNRRWYHRTYENAFVGSDAVTALVNMGAAKTREEAVQLGRQVARTCNVFEHVEGDHELKDGKLFYRFRSAEEFERTAEKLASLKGLSIKEEEEGADSTNFTSAEMEARDSISETLPISGKHVTLMAKAQRFKKEVEVKECRWCLRVYSGVFVGREAVTFLVDSGLAKSRAEAVQIGQKMATALNLFEHVAQDHEFQDGYLFYRFVQVRTRSIAIRSSVRSGERKSAKDIWFNPSELLGDDSDCLWKQKIVKFEKKISSRDLSRRESIAPQKQKEIMTLDGVGPTSEATTPFATVKVKDWVSRFRRMDPRYRIEEFFSEVAQIGVEDIVENGVDLKKARPILRFFFMRASVFSIWRPTSFEAIRKMMLGQAVGKGLDIKGKSAKRGKLSAFVPFLQIGENRHKRLIRTLPKDGTLRLFFPSASAKSRDIAVANLERICEEMLDTTSRAKEVIADEHSSEGSREDAKETLLWDMTDPVIRFLDETSPQSYGVEIPVRLFWEAYIVRQDISRKPGSQYDTGRPSCPPFQDMNFAALRAKPRPGHPRCVIWQNADPTDPMNPYELLMAYEEHGKVLPVVSDFDPFLVGTRRVAFDPIGGQLPSDQLDIMKWCVDQIGGVLDGPPGPESWTNRWLQILKEATSKGFHPNIPRFGFGDPKSYSIMENAVKRFSRDGAVRHGSECFNYYFPQELDDEFLVISDKFDGVPWKYMDAEGMQDFLCTRLNEGFTFPLNPKWILCDPGWKDIYDQLVASKNETVQASMQIWFPPSSGVREQIEDICARHPDGFERESKHALAKKGKEDM